MTALGAGDIGEVYRARGTKLKRDVIRAVDGTFLLPAVVEQEASLASVPVNVVLNWPELLKKK
jgi:hypothetical protein